MWRNIRQYYTPWLDVLTLGIMVATIIYVLLSFGKLPTEIPMHFNMAGEADGWGHKGMLFGLMVLNIHAVLLCFILNYFLIVKSDNTADSLQLINIPFIKKEELTEEQVRIVKKYAARMTAIINFMVSLMFAIIYYDIIQIGLGRKGDSDAGILTILILIFLPIIYYTWRIYHEVKNRITPD